MTVRVVGVCRLSVESGIRLASDPAPPGSTAEDEPTRVRTESLGTNTAASVT
ncbi:hypothetical protein [Salinigranum marinum]|uniref:hypothetical protein n=1 Tax=Salinigranum marinum TaxID=1515595 RepID=UPI002989F1CC|nr:hypothetical protein [Salinigranum marinum]